MAWQKLLGGLAWLAVIFATLGAVLNVARNVSTETGHLVVLAFTAVVVVGLVVAGARSREWLAGTYW
jgi:hypothetical protein